MKTRCIHIFSVIALLIPVASASAAPNAIAAQADAMTQKALDYLKSKQQPSGAWQAPTQPPGITALVIRAFVLDPHYKSDQPFIKKGYQSLLSAQGKQGGISEDMLANYNTAIAISAFAAAHDKQYQSAIDKAVAFLRNLQWDDHVEGPDASQRQVPQSDPRFGGWGYGHHSRPDGSNVQMSMEALHDAGIKPGDPAYKNAMVFISRMQNRSESNDQAWSGDDGGFVYTPADGGDSKAGAYTAPNGQRRLRSYASMTYAGFKSMLYAGLSKDDPRVQAAWHWINTHWSVDENTGMGEADPSHAQQGLYYCYLTMARALHAYGQPIITDPQGRQHDWRVELTQKLATLQHPDGSFSGEQRWMEGDPVLVTSYCALALQEIQQDLKVRSVK
jgi:squalene-hopene/tetraprenyl-beta-curcumene cyclase